MSVMSSNSALSQNYNVGDILHQQYLQRGSERIIELLGGFAFLQQNWRIDSTIIDSHLDRINVRFKDIRSQYCDEVFIEHFHDKNFCVSFFRNYTELNKRTQEIMSKRQRICTINNVSSDILQKILVEKLQVQKLELKH